MPEKIVRGNSFSLKYLKVLIGPYSDRVESIPINLASGIKINFRPIQAKGD